MSYLSFTVPGEPVPKERARVVRSKKTGEIHGITPARTRAYEKLVRDVAAIAVRKQRWKRRTTPVQLALVVYRARAAGDATNFVKSIEDGCNEVVWDDDRRVMRIVIDMIDGGTPRVDVVVSDLAVPLGGVSKKEDGDG